MRSSLSCSELSACRRLRICNSRNATTAACRPKAASPPITRFRCCSHNVGCLNITTALVPDYVAQGDGLTFLPGLGPLQPLLLGFSKPRGKSVDFTGYWQRHIEA